MTTSDDGERGIDVTPPDEGGDHNRQRGDAVGRDPLDLGATFAQGTCAALWLLVRMRSTPG